MLTIFTIPKPFTGLIRIIQRNAIKNWVQLIPECEVILFGNDIGVEEVAQELGVRYFSSIEKNEYGTPLLSSAFGVAQEQARNDILMYANSDIIFSQDLVEAISKVDKSLFLVCGRRWDLDVKEEIDFGDGHAVGQLLDRLKKEGKLHGLSGLDYFVFPRGAVHMRSFPVGRPGWDSWLIYDMRRRGVPVIDATEAITAIHQNHDYSHSIFGEQKRVGGPELLRNIGIAGGMRNFLSLRDADWVLDKGGLKRPYFPRRIWSLLSQYYPYRVVLSLKRNLQMRMGF